MPSDKNIPVETLYKAACYLGESPFWHSKRESVLWVDIEHSHLYELNLQTGKLKKWELNRRASFIVEHESGHILLGMQGGLFAFNLDSGVTSPVIDIELGNDDYRCNDGYCDQQGRLWFGVMHMKAELHAGSLNCLYPDGKLQKMITGLTIPNGIAWSHDTRTMYFVDSETHDVKAFNYDEAKGELVFNKVVFEISKDEGTPDGLTIDSEGMLWIAVYGGAKVIRCNPVTGAISDVINLPVPHVTNCCFAGPDLNDLIITTAQENLTEEQLPKYPESGNVFIARNIGAKGVKNNKSNH